MFFTGHRCVGPGDWLESNDTEVGNSMAGNILDWQAESVHAIIFSQPTSDSVVSLFNTAFGVPPESSSENFHAQTGKVGSASSASVNLLQKTVSSQPGRIEIFAHSAGDGPDGFPAKITDTLTAIEEISAAAQKVAKIISGVSRIAVHCRLTRHFDALEQANAQIGKVIPFTYDVKSRRDFMFQVNELTKVGNVDLNRIVKWSVDAVQVIMGGSPFGIMQTAGHVIVKNSWAAVVHLDFNTVVPRPIFTTDEVIEALSVAEKEMIKTRKSNLRFS